MEEPAERPPIGARTPETKVSAPPPRLARLGLIARRKPFRPGVSPVVGSLGGPAEMGRCEKSPERPAGVVVDVGCETQLAARPQDPRERLDHRIGNDPALVVAPLRPGVGI